MRGKLRALILDIDGTLVKSSIDWKLVRRKLAGLGITVGKEPVAEAINRLFSTNRELALRAEREVRRVEWASALMVRRDEELINLLTGVKELGLKLAVVTLRGRRSAEEVLRRLGIIDLIDELVSREDECVRAKQLDLVIRRLRVSRDEALFLGDTFLDVRAAGELGVKFSLIDSSNDRINTVPKGLKDLLRRLLSRLSEYSASSGKSPFKE